VIALLALRKAASICHPKSIHTYFNTFKQQRILRDMPRLICDSFQLKHFHHISWSKCRRHIHLKEGKSVVIWVVSRSTLFAKNKIGMSRSTKSSWLNKVSSSSYYKIWFWWTNLCKLQAYLCYAHANFVSAVNHKNDGLFQVL
jgi:hypothetical protein